MSRWRILRPLRSFQSPTKTAYRLRVAGSCGCASTGMRSGRSRRGKVRLAILSVLGEQPMHGYQVIQELQTRTQGRWKPSAGSVYPTLQLLEDEGLLHQPRT